MRSVRTKIDPDGRQNRDSKTSRTVIGAGSSTPMTVPGERYPFDPTPEPFVAQTTLYGKVPSFLF